MSQVGPGGARIRANRGSLRSMPLCSSRALPARAAELGVARFLDRRVRYMSIVAAEMVGREVCASILAWWGICLLVLVAPFEASEPLVRLPGQSLSSVE